MVVSCFLMQTIVLSIPNIHQFFIYICVSSINHFLMQTIVPVSTIRSGASDDIEASSIILGLIIKSDSIFALLLFSVLFAGDITSNVMFFLQILNETLQKCSSITMSSTLKYKFEHSIMVLKDSLQNYEKTLKKKCFIVFW